MLYDLVLEDTANKRSAVTGRSWKGLSKKYKALKSKVAPGEANLELTGNMLDSLKVKPYRDGIEIGIYGRKEALKAENHIKTTKRSEKTKVPQRQFLPRKGETFRSGILKELKSLAQEVIEYGTDQD